MSNAASLRLAFGCQYEHMLQKSRKGYSRTKFTYMDRILAMRKTASLQISIPTLDTDLEKGFELDKAQSIFSTCTDVGHEEGSFLADVKPRVCYGLYRDSGASSSNNGVATSPPWSACNVGRRPAGFLRDAVVGRAHAPHHCCCCTTCMIT